MYSTGSSMKWSKKRHQWENSTQSMRVEGDSFTAWSYGQKIGTRHGEYYLFNYNNYSVTTSGHQSTMNYFLRQQGFKIVNVYMSTLNNGFSYEGLQKFEGNFDAVAIFFPAKLKEFKKEAEAEATMKRERINRDNMRSKVDNFKYKTRKGFEKAMKALDLKKPNETPSVEYWKKMYAVNNVDDILSLKEMGYEWSEIEKDWLNVNFKVWVNQWADLRKAGIDADKYISREKYANFKDWTYAVKLGFKDEIADRFTKPKIEYYWGLEDDSEFIEIADLIALIEDKDNAIEGKRLEKIEERIAVAKLDGLAS